MPIAPSKSFHGLTSGYHPDAGLGLSEAAVASLQAARKLESLIKPWDVAPRDALLGKRGQNVAYLAAEPGIAYALYFTDGGDVELDLRGHAGPFRVRWIELATGAWAGETTLRGDSKSRLNAPAAGGWVAAIVK